MLPVGDNISCGSNVYTYSHHVRNNIVTALQHNTKGQYYNLRFNLTDS